MPKLSRFFIRIALIYLFLGFTFGALILANKGIPFAPVVWALLPIHIEILILGWLTQLALGVAFWILPRLGSESPRGNEIWSWATLILVNAGILLNSFGPFAAISWLGLIARLFQAAGFATFVIGNWKRLYPPKWAVQSNG